MSAKKLHLGIHLLALGAFVIGISGCKVQPILNQGKTMRGTAFEDGAALENEVSLEDRVVREQEAENKNEEETEDEIVLDLDAQIQQLAQALNVNYTRIDSPNYDEHRGAIQGPNILVVGYTAVDKDASMKAFTQGGVSVHYLVDEAGNITRLVQEEQRAWHAGCGSWKEETDVNSASIGIGMVTLGYNEKSTHPAGGTPIDGDNTRVQAGKVPRLWYALTPKMTKTTGLLAKIITNFYQIKPDNVIAHGDMATDAQGNLGRKVDPGPLFPWKDFYNEYEIGAWYDLAEPLKEVELPEATEEDEVTWVQRHLKKYGYACPQTGKLDGGTSRAVQAFQRHFRPANISGKIDPETIRILASLVDRYIPAE